LLLTPLFYLVMVFIKLESGGPVFFKQKRVGRNLNKFLLIKFRSMTIDKDCEKKQFEPGSRGRVTKFGSFLRKSKIDELPELFNIVRGDMSLVGPRPEVGKYVQLYPDHFKSILKLRPGLSDYASLKYRNEEELLSRQADPELFYIQRILPDKLRLAKMYAQDVDFQSDITIISETMKCLVPFSCRGKTGKKASHALAASLEK